MELGVYSFGDVQREPITGTRRSTAEAMRNLVQAIRLADEVGLDYFGIGEHHTYEAPASAAAVILAAAASCTKRIRLGSAVTVLSTEDPVRLFQQFATLDAVSGGRAEITAGRGSSTESFALFGYDLDDYDALFAEKLDLLLRLNTEEFVTWRGKFRPALDRAIVVPRPERGRLPIWLGTGGNRESSVRAGVLGLPIAYGVIGGQPARFAPLVELYKKAARESNAVHRDSRVSMGTLGYVAGNSQRAREEWYPPWSRAMMVAARERGFTPLERAQYDRDASAGGAYMVAGPEEVAERLVRLHQAVGHDRHFLQMDIGGLPHEQFLNSIELLGTRVKPLVDARLG